jgi:hypothetical protein
LHQPTSTSRSSFQMGHRLLRSSRLGRHYGPTVGKERPRMRAINLLNSSGSYRRCIRKRQGPINHENQVCQALLRYRRRDRIHIESQNASVSLVLNGKARSVDVDPSMPPLFVLRDSFDREVPRFSCGLGNADRARLLSLRQGSLTHHDGWTCQK